MLFQIVNGEPRKVDPSGSSSPLGGHVYNSEEWITESGTWTAPVTGWYDLWIAAGGQGGAANASSYSNDARRGRSGVRVTALRYYTKGQEINVVIGAGGAQSNTTSQTIQKGASGGDTTFGDIIAHADLDGYITTTVRYEDIINCIPRGATQEWEEGVRENNTNLQTMTPGYELCYGAGGYAVCGLNNPMAQPGVQGAVRLRFWNPAKASGPLPEPALFMARAAARMASRPAVVSLYDPETGHGSVWLEEDAEAKLADGLITQEEWREICAQKAAEEHAAWLINPDTVEERFSMLRSARDAKLSATDYLVTPDYPITAEQRQAVMEYRQALRDLPDSDGAPWDGGGENTPWPSMPTIEKQA